jgi:hypothetical protein
MAGQLFKGIFYNKKISKETKLLAGKFKIPEKNPGFFIVQKYLE